MEMKHEYHEGKQAGENFEKLARAVFQTPRVENPKRPAVFNVAPTHFKTKCLPANHHGIKWIRATPIRTHQ